MRFPRLRFSIRAMMVAVVLASVILLLIVAERERQRASIALPEAEARYMNAKLTREVAEIAVSEYLGAFLQEDRAEGEAEIAEAHSRANAARKLSDAAAIDMAEAALRRGREKMRVLEKRLVQMGNELRAELQKAKAEERARQADLDRIRAAWNRFIW